MPQCLACAHGDLRKCWKKQAETFLLCDEKDYTLEGGWWRPENYQKTQTVKIKIHKDSAIELKI